MKKLLILLFCTALFKPSTLLAQNANSNGTNHFLWDFEVPVEIPCTGDLILLEGEIFFLNHSTWNGKAYIGKDLAVPRGITGTNTRTGEKYLLVGAESSRVYWSNIDYKTSMRWVFHLSFIGQGKDANFFRFELAFERYNRNGELVLDIYRVSTECR